MGLYSIGLDFGTESARALLLDVGECREVASEVYRYPHGVIDTRLPLEGESIVLPPDWALQDPDDYLRSIEVMIPRLLRNAGVSADDVIGIGVDFTSCTMLPTTSDATPLCVLPEFRRSPHAWVKLWKHHAAQGQASKINRIAGTRHESWLDRYGGSVSSEWFFPKILEIVEDAAHVYSAADCFIEAADWVVWRLTGTPQLSACTAGYKAFWSPQDGFPHSSFFSELDPRLEAVVGEKLPSTVGPVGERAGGLTEDAARMTGLKPGTSVATAMIDAHASVPGSTVAESGRMVLITGTSLCQIVLDQDFYPVRGIAGSVEGGIVPGLFAYEAGQPSFGDTFAWTARILNGPSGVATTDRLDVLEREAKRIGPGKTGLLALDWLNGNRSILDDSELSGVLVGATLATTAADVYRAMIEGSAFGTRVIVEEFEASGVEVDELVACGGPAQKSDLLLQIMADVCGRPIKRALSRQTSALGAALYGAVAAGRSRGGFVSIEEAVSRVTKLDDRVWEPVDRHLALYDRLYAEYRTLYDYFGRRNRVMSSLKSLRN